ncbi:MAG: hypothetical protein KBG15_23595 [Kofleriaceae bacterium]|nr:hypothetical protein [Kofleriaceae bacterium]
MGSLSHISARHAKDGWRDLVFVGLLLIATVLPTVSLLAPRTPTRPWHLTVTEGPVEVLANR